MPEDIGSLVWLIGGALLISLLALVRSLVGNAFENIKKNISGLGNSVDSLRTNCERRDKKSHYDLNAIQMDLKDEIHEVIESMSQYATMKQIETVNLRIDELTKEIGKCATHDDVDRLQKSYEINFKQLFSDIGELKGILRGHFNQEQS